jgi:hypothetical protein
MIALNLGCRDLNLADNMASFAVLAMRGGIA